jgi:hypothetical protein
MKTFQLPESTAQKVLDYLANQPYKDVYILVAEMMKLQPLEPNPPLAYENKEK